MAVTRRIQLLPQALCGLQDIKDVLQQDMSDQFDDVFALSINSFTEMAEGDVWCDREFEYRGRVEYFDGPAARLLVKAPPIDISNESTIKLFDGGIVREFTNSTLLSLWTDYGVLSKEGIVKMQFCQLSSGLQGIRLEYMGGLVTPIMTAGTPMGPKIVPFDLRQACAMQVVAWFRNKSFWGLEQVSVPGGGVVAISDPTKILPYVREVLMKYKRFDY